MRIEQLREEALSLPLKPGVYIMKDKNGAVIYVGKAKKLKNRVCQYFQNTATHSPKTKRLVSNIESFDVIVAASEFEALVLECSLIKQHMPKYNILLKDDKGYPYLRLSRDTNYPILSMASKVLDDGAEYFGPFGSRGITQSLLEALQITFLLPQCNKKFPRDIGKTRPCLHYHMKQCYGWCLEAADQKEYQNRIDQVRQILSGNYKSVAALIQKEMLEASDALNFELAVSLRDRLRAIETLGRKQIVAAGTNVDTDAIGYAQTETKACFSVLHFSGGNLIDKDYEIFSVPDNPELAVSSLVQQYYLNRGFAPKQILLPFAIEDSNLLQQLFQERFLRKTAILVPQKGEKLRLVEMGNKNADEEAIRVTGWNERIHASLELLGKMLCITPPTRIEAYDISHISGTDSVGSMVVFTDGKPKKSAYKRFKINDLPTQDDYGAMRQVLQRRFSRYVNEDSDFSEKPDLILIDGGLTHAQTAVRALEELNLCFPVFGMVKDNRHRTRALISVEGEEIRIDNQQSVFSLIGAIQEETHRFAIKFHRELRSKRLRHSQLDDIPGIGEKRKELLLRTFRSVRGIQSATIRELEQYLPRNAANAVYRHFHTEQEEGKPCE